MRRSVSSCCSVSHVLGQLFTWPTSTSFQTDCTKLCWTQSLQKTSHSFHIFHPVRFSCAWQPFDSTALIGNSASLAVLPGNRKNCPEVATHCEFLEQLVTGQWQTSRYGGSTKILSNIEQWHFEPYINILKQLNILQLSFSNPFFFGQSLEPTISQP